MKKIKLLILLSQVGRIWSRGFVEKKLFQTLTALAFFELFLNRRPTEEESQEYNDFQNTQIK